MNPTRKLAPASILIAGAEAPQVADHAEVLHLISPTRTMPPELTQRLQSQATEQAQLALDHASLAPLRLDAPGTPLPRRSVGASAVVVASKGIARSLARASAAGAMVDGGIAAVEAAVAYYNNQISGREAAAHVGREAATGAASAAAGTAAVAALVVITGPVSAPIAALVGTTAALGARTGIRKGTKQIGKALVRGPRALMKLAA